MIEESGASVQAMIKDLMQREGQDAKGRCTPLTNPSTSTSASTSASDKIDEAPKWQVWTHSDDVKRPVPENYVLPNVTLSAALRLWEDGVAHRNIRPFRLLKADDWALAGEDTASKNKSRHRFHHWQLVMGDLSALCNNDRPKLTSPGMATPISDYCLFIKAKVNGVANVEGRKRKRAYNTQPMGLLMRTLYRVMVQHRPSKELSKEFQNFCQTVLRRKRPIV